MAHFDFYFLSYFQHIRMNKVYTLDASHKTFKFFLKRAKLSFTTLSENSNHWFHKKNQKLPNNGVDTP
jgi:hypothetical protein